MNASNKLKSDLFAKLIFPLSSSDSRLHCSLRAWTKSSSSLILRIGFRDGESLDGLMPAGNGYLTTSLGGGSGYTALGGTAVLTGETVVLIGDVAGLIGEVL